MVASNDQEASTDAVCKHRNLDRSPDMLEYLFSTPGRIDWEKEDYGGFERNEIGLEYV